MNEEITVVNPGDSVSSVLDRAQMDESVSEVTGEGEVVRLFLETPFDDYTVSEGLLLTLFLCVIAAALIKLLKEGFYWLW